MHRDMRHTANVPELRKNLPTLGMHGFSDFAPAWQVLIFVNARGVQIAASLVGDRQAFGDQQAGRSTLRVIQCVGFIWNVVQGTGAGHRRHDNTVFQRNA
ncbi:hypothetical protein D3C72_1552160 [compost metagenome]